MAAVDDAVLARGRNDFAELHDRFPVRGEHVADRLDGVRLHDDDHADATIEGAQELELGNARLQIRKVPEPKV